MKRLIILLTLIAAAFTIFTSSAGATTPIIVQGVAQTTNPGTINQSVTYNLLDMGGIGDIPRQYINTSSYTGSNLIITAGSDTVIVPSIKVNSIEQKINITVNYIDGESSTFWLYSHQYGLFTDVWTTIGSGTMSVSRWELLGSSDNTYYIDPAYFTCSGSGQGSYTGKTYGFFFHRGGDNWGIGSAIQGGQSATGIKSITVTSQYNVTLAVKRYDQTNYTNNNTPPSSSDFLSQIQDRVKDLITLITDIWAFIAFILWFIVFFITNLPLLVVDIESLIILISCSTGRDRIEMGINFVHYNSILTQAAIVIIKGLVASLAPAIQAISSFAQATAQVASTIVQGVAGVAATILALIF